MASAADFVGTATRLSDADVEEAASANGLEPEVIWAVCDVESRGSGFLPTKQPIILYEAHVFGRLTGHQWDQSHPNISAPRWDRSLYGPGGLHQYDRLVEAIGLDRTAALESASWGMFQILGLNFKSLGFADVGAMVTGMMDSEKMQLAAFVVFCKTNHLLDALRGHDWTRFALGYNGPGQADNGYDVKLAAAYARRKAAGGAPHASNPPPQAPPAGRDPAIQAHIAAMVAAVRVVQTDLAGLDLYDGPIDGDWGPGSRTALQQWNKRS